VKLLDQFIAHSANREKTGGMDEPGHTAVSELCGKTDERGSHAKKRHQRASGGKKRQHKEIPMKKIFTSVIAALVMSGLLLGLSGCKAGPAERAGKNIDKTIEKGKDKVENIGK